MTDTTDTVAGPAEAAIGIDGRQPRSRALAYDPIPSYPRPMPDRIDALRAVLAEELPITQHLGIAVVGVDERGVSLRMPLAANRNHKGTMFAGSLGAATTLAGWCLLWLVADGEGIPAHVVIQDGTTKYLRPVTRDCIALAAWPAPDALDEFLETLRRRRMARIAIEARVTQDGVDAVHFSGRYVVQRHDGAAGAAPRS
jgi:thioesterase domain-containing protein